MLTIKFTTDNEAFTEDGRISAQCEIARILREIAEHVEQNSIGGNIFDLNGNKIGKWSWDYD